MGSQVSVRGSAPRLQLQEISERQARVADWRAAETQVRAEAETREICCTRR